MAGESRGALFWALARPLVGDVNARAWMAGERAGLRPSEGGSEGGRCRWVYSGVVKRGVVGFRRDKGSLFFV